MIFGYEEVINMYVIETFDLCKKYNSKLVIQHVNMHVPEHAIYGFVGENGSGKTTIMRLVTGLAEPSSGSFNLFGASNKSKEIYEKRKNVSALVEAASLVPTMTALENMRYQEAYQGIKLNNDERNELLKKVHLEDVGKKKVKNYSLGMRQRLAIALALMNKPKLMLLDEPMNGLDPEGIAELRDLLIELNQKEGLTILISSHILSELEKIASCYGFISHGSLLEELSLEELQSRCRKSLCIKVNDITKAEEALNSLNLKEVNYFPNGDLKIYDDVKINDIVRILDKHHIDILMINSNDESVEDYYLKLVKGE